LGDDVAELAATVEAFASWLEGEFTASGVNLHSIDVVADLQVTRYRYIKMCGDIAKHNLARLPPILVIFASCWSRPAIRERAAGAPCCRNLLPMVS
jgi:hypothetical protein